jgi:hypothetical protein
MILLMRRSKRVLRVEIRRRQRVVADEHNVALVRKRRKEEGHEQS